MSRARIKHAVGLLIVLCIALFFYRAFQENWASLRLQRLDVSYLALVGSALLVVLLLLLGTVGWRLAINSLSSGRKLTFAECVAIVNTSALTKYIPGRVWSYALQMYWLSGVGIRMSVVVYSNLVSHLIAIISCFMAGLLCWVSAAPAALVGPLLAILALVVAADLLAMRFHSAFSRMLMPALGRLLRREIQPLELPMRLLLQLHGIHFVGAILTGVCSYVMCIGIGYPLSREEAPLVIASGLLGDVAGTLVLVVPGGLGVREGVMYLLLGGASNGFLALVFPIASRLIAMVVDLVVGAVSFVMLRRFNRPPAEAVEQLP